MLREVLGRSLTCEGLPSRQLSYLGVQLQGSALVEQCLQRNLISAYYKDINVFRAPVEIKVVKSKFKDKKDTGTTLDEDTTGDAAADEDQDH